MKMKIHVFGVGTPGCAATARLARDRREAVRVHVASGWSKRHPPGPARAAATFDCGRDRVEMSARQFQRRLLGFLKRRLLTRVTTLAAAISFALPASSATFRWVTSSNRIYVENGGSVA